MVIVDRVDRPAFIMTASAADNAVDEALNQPVESMQLSDGTNGTQAGGSKNGSDSDAGADDLAKTDSSTTPAYGDNHGGMANESELLHPGKVLGEASSDTVAKGTAANGKTEHIMGPESKSTGEGADASMSADELRNELARARQERDSFEGQYRGLLNKLGQMRSTLGDRLRQDAEELDRREQQIDGLTARVEELDTAVETLKAELVGSHDDVDRVSKELDAARSLNQQQNDTASVDRRGTEARLRETQEMAERYRMDAEGWESACMEERARRDDIDLEIREARRERDEALAREQEQASIAAREAGTAHDLQQVLEEFQATQESDVQRALSDHEDKLGRMSALLEEHTSRTADAEKLASEYKGAAGHCQALEKEVKEKNLLIGKLRHEGKSSPLHAGHGMILHLLKYATPFIIASAAVILNEHLTESLRRLRASTSDSSIDGKLITNLLMQFLNTPRTDTKRFEMLSLIGSVLNWTDEDRERAGLLQAKGGAGERKVGVSATARGNGGSGLGHRRQTAATGGSASTATGEEVSEGLEVTATRH